MSDSRANIVISATDNFSRMFAQLKGELSSTSDRFGGLKTVVGSAAAAIGIGAFASSIAKAISDLGALDDAAEKTGISVEKLSQFEQVAKIGGASLDLITDAAIKLTKGLNGTDEETAKASKALTALGIDARDAAGNLRDPGVIIEEVAKKLDGFKDSNAKTAIAIDLFGKSGANLLPFLKDYAQAGEVAVTVTAAQAAAAEETDKQIKRLGVSFENNKRILAGEALPVFKAVADLLIDIQKESTRVGGNTGAREFAEGVARALAFTVDAGRGVVFVFKALGAYLAGLALDAGSFADSAAKQVAAGAAFAAGQTQVATALLSSAKESFAKVGEGARFASDDINKLFDDFAKGSYLSRLEAKLAEGAMRSLEDRGFNPLEKAVLKYGAAKEAKTKADKEDRDIVPGILADIAQRIAAETALADTGQKLTDQQKFALKTTLALADAKNKVTDETKALVTRALEELLAHEANNDALKVGSALYKSAVEDIDRINAARIESVSRLEGEAAAAEEAVRNYGKTKQAIYTELAARAQRMRDLAAEAGESDNQIAALERQRDAYLRLAQAVGDTDALDASRKLAEDQIRAYDDLERTTTDFFTDFILNGGKAFESVGQAAKRFFAQLAAQAAAKYAINLVLGTSGGSNPLSSIFSGGGGLGSIFGDIARDDGVGGVVPGAGILGALGNLIPSASGLLGGVSAAVPYLGPIAAAASAIAAIAKSFDKEGLRINNGTVNRDGTSAQPNEIRRTALRNFYIEGDIDQKILDPLAAKISQVDSLIATNLLDATTIAQVRNRLETAIDPEWIGFKKDPAAAFGQASKEYLQNSYAAVFESIDATLAARIKDFGGTGDELLALVESAAVLAPALREVNAQMPGLNLSLAGLVDLTVEERGALAELTAALPKVAQDGWAQVLRIQKDSLRGLATQFADNVSASRALISSSQSGAIGLSALSQALAGASAQFEQLTASLATIGLGITDLINGTNEQFLLATLDNEAKYKYFQDRAQSEFERIATLTDGEAVDRAVRSADNARSQAFGLLDPEEQRARLNEFLAGGQALNDAGQAQIKAIAETAGAQNKEFADVIAKAMLDAIAKQSTVVEKQDAVVDKQDASVDRFATAINSLVTQGIRLEIAGAGGVEAGREL